MAGSLAIVVQCFNKPDTLRGLLDSLLRCEGHNNASLIIWQDNARDGRREAEFISAFNRVNADVVNFIGNHGRSFRTVDYRFNDRNLGPYATCKAALDFAFEKHDFIVFMEDDILLSADALVWFNDIRATGLLEDQNNWAIAGQSIFFDARGKAIDPLFVAKVSEVAREQGLVNRYTIHDFVPSACFATTRRWWAEFGSTRGEPRGDVSLCQRTKDEGRGCIFPIVPRAKDVGMLHDNGFSVTIHTKEGVEAITTPYLLAEDLLPEKGPQCPNLKRFDGDAGLLFRQTTLLEGFLADTSARERAASAASEAKAWRRAAALWDELRGEHRQEPRYWLKAGEAFSAARMLDRAEDILSEGLSLFPHHNWIAYRYGLVASDAGKWEEAFRRAERLRLTAPDFWPGWVAATEALAVLKRACEAEDMARQAVDRFPAEFWPNYWLTRLEAARSDARGAVRIWTKLVSRFPAEAAAIDALKTAAMSTSSG